MILPFFKHFNPIFHLLFELYLLVYLIFTFQALQDFISGVPFALCYGL